MLDFYICKLTVRKIVLKSDIIKYGNMYIPQEVFCGCASADYLTTQSFFFSRCTDIHDANAWKFQKREQTGQNVK